MAHHGSATAQKRKYPEPEAEETAGMCVNGCDFYGAAATANMCSKCYNELVASDTRDWMSVFDHPASTAPPPEKKPKTILSAASSTVADLVYNHSNKIHQNIVKLVCDIAN
jgi:hypothetical protein